MKGRIPVLPILLSATILAGCSKPTPPAFDPTGNALAYEKGSALYLHAAEGERKISDEVVGAIAWSPDGGRIAFERDGGATIYSLSDGHKVELDHFAGPFAWEGSLLTCVIPADDDKAPKLATVRPDSGAILLQNDLPCTPDEMLPLSWGAYLNDGQSAYYYDGHAVYRLPALDGLAPVVDDGNGGLVMDQIEPDAGGYRHQATLFDWPGGIHDAPRAVATISAPGSRSHLSQILGIWSTPNIQTVVVLTEEIQGASPAEDQALKSLAARYGLLSRKPRGTSRPVTDRLNRILDRATVRRLCFFGPPAGPFRQVAGSLKSSQLDSARIELNPQGTKLAIVTDDSLKFYSLPGPGSG